MFGKWQSWLVVLFASLTIATFTSSAENANGAAQITSSQSIITLDRITYPIPTNFQDLKVTVRVSDQDFDTSPNGIDKIATDVLGQPGVGPIKISVKRGADAIILGYAGGQSTNNGVLDSKPIANTPSEKAQIKQFGPITETFPDSGIFQFDVTIKSIDGPESSKCPVSTDAQDRFDDSTNNSRHCILQGDVILVEYTDPSDFSWNQRTVTSSAAFSSLNPSFSGSSSEKITTEKYAKIGKQFTILLYDSNLNLDSEKAESYSLDLIRFKSSKIKLTMGPKGGAQDSFNAKPSSLRETGDNTGIFYTSIEIPRTIKGQTINIGEKIEFEYIQRGLGGFLVVHHGGHTSDKPTHPSTPEKSYENQTVEKAKPSETEPKKIQKQVNPKPSPPYDLRVMFSEKISELKTAYKQNDSKLAKELLDELTKLRNQITDMRKR